VVTAGTVLGLTAVVLAVFAAIGVWYARGRITTVEDFISARNSAGRRTLTATIVASSMGAWILFSPAEAGAAFGGVTAVLGYALGSALPLLAYAVVGPRIRRLIPEGHSITEYAYARYGSAMYAYVLLASVAYMFVFLAAEFTGIASALSLLAGVPGWQTAALVGATVFAYTVYGGLRSSMFTDVLQTLLVLPLLAISVGVVFLVLGGPFAAFEAVSSTRPELFSLGYLPGLEFGVYVAVAVLAAEMVNQAWWQRVYAARDTGTLSQSFGLAAVLVVPMVVAVGLLGPLAVGLGLVDGTGDASVSFFLVVNEVLPDWAVLVVAVLAVLLVVSSADTLFNAIASVVTADLPRLLDVDETRLTAVARLFTGVVALGATVVGMQGYSVLTLFLFADLLAAATFVPLLFGLYSRTAWEGGAVAGNLAGLAVGLAFFPPARGALDAVGLGPLLPAGSFLWSFLGAAGVSALVVALTARIGRRTYDLGRLAREVHRLDVGEEEASADGGRPRD
jgi:Na+/proline symporter